MREDPIISGGWVKALLTRCTQAANGDIDKITACFDRFNRGH